MNSPKNILTRTAPDPKPGQDRVRETVKLAIEGLTGIRPSEIRDDINLGQLIVPKDVDGRVGERMKEVPQDEAVLEYISGTIAGSNPLIDIADGVKKLKRSISMFHVPQIMKKITDGGKITPGKLIGRFAMVRHGDKEKDGTLSEKGIQEARDAGMHIKTVSEAGNTPITAVFGVQQPNVQMLMSAFQIGTHPEEISQEDTPTLIRKNWESLPEAWKEPYRTGEVTFFDVIISSSFNVDYYKTITPENRNEYVTNMLRISIQRNGHTEIYDLKALERYVEVIESFQGK